MNILHVLPYYNPKRGGDVNVCTNLAKELVKNGHEVTILTTDFECDINYLNQLKEFGINIVSIKTLFNIGLFIYSPQIKNWLKINLNDFDVIHLHTFRAYQNNIVLEYAEKFGIPYIIQAHGSLLTFFQKNKLKRIYDYFWGIKLLKGASKVFALTETEYNQYRIMGVLDDKIEIVPNGINLSEYQKLSTKGEFKKKYNLSHEEKIILYLGRLNKNKGIDLLISAFSEIIKDQDKVKLVIAGPDDGDYKVLKNIVNNLMMNDKVLFIGPIYEKEKLNAYIDADVFVTPSFYGFPVTFIEALACETPIITTDKGDKIDWIDNNVGYVVGYDKDQLSEAILNILFDDDLKKRFGHHGKNLVRTMFNWELIINQIENIYNNL